MVLVPEIGPIYINLCHAWHPIEKDLIILVSKFLILFPVT
jgi:hypothetical protein